MLPGNAYYDKEGKFLGYYEYKAWGTFFPFQNQIWANPQEFLIKLNEISEIEYQTIREHFIIQKNKKKSWNKSISYLELDNISVKEPPWQKLGIHQKITSENRY
jgi:hypothetical protein